MNTSLYRLPKIARVVPPPRLPFLVVAGDFAEGAAPSVGLSRKVLKYMALDCAVFGFLNTFSPLFGSAPLLTFVPLVGYLAFHTADSNYLLAYAVLMIPFFTAGFIGSAFGTSPFGGIAGAWDGYFVNPVTRSAHNCGTLFNQGDAFKGDAGAFCAEGWLNTLTVLGFFNAFQFLVTGFSALVWYVQGQGGKAPVVGNQA